MLSRNRTRRTVWMGLLAVVAAVAWGQAQESTTPREQMNEPVYRVGSTNNDDGPTERTARSSRPLLDPSLRSGDKPVLQQPVLPNATIPTAAGTLKHPKLLEALDDAEQCLANIRATIDDYTCLLVRRETVNGVQSKTEYIHTKIRNRKIENGQVVKPFSIYTKFLKPDDCKGREAVYVEGQNKGKMRIKEGGLRGRWLPAVWLATDSPLILKWSRYPITEAGIENLAVKLLERGLADDGNVAETDYTVEYKDGATLNKRSCKYLRIEFFTRKPVNDAQLIEVFIDEALMIPVRYVAYGWPAAAGSTPPVLEEYTYLRLKLNCGLTDADFSHDNPKYNL